MWTTLPDMLVLGGLWVVHFHYVTCFRATLSLADQPSACECGIQVRRFYRKTYSMLANPFKVAKLFRIASGRA